MIPGRVSWRFDLFPVLLLCGPPRGITTSNSFGSLAEASVAHPISRAPSEAPRGTGQQVHHSVDARAAWWGNTVADGEGCDELVVDLGAGWAAAAAAVDADFAARARVRLGGEIRRWPC